MMSGGYFFTQAHVVTCINGRNYRAEHAIFNVYIQHTCGSKQKMSECNKFDQEIKSMDATSL